MKRRIFIVALLVVLVIPEIVYAQRGCCSHHGGVAGCSSSGRQICNDGTLSPTCTCSTSSSSQSKSTTNSKKSVTYIYGCTDKSAFNYNAKATKDDGSCVAKKYGCMDKNAINFDKNANIDDSTCQYEKNIVDNEIISYDIEYKENANINIITSTKEGITKII